jgi:RNA polymerase sigma factor (sigma-70 family)
MAAPLHFLSQDAKLLARMREGDEEALVTLYQQNKKAVVALVTRNSGTTTDADDILQEALIVLWERVRSGRYEHTAKLETFVYATARNIWRRRLARHRRERPTDFADDSLVADETSPLDRLIETEEASLISNVLNRLGEPCRTLLRLFYWEEASMGEIARRMGFANAETVKSKKYQCKKALQAMLTDPGSSHD